MAGTMANIFAGNPMSTPVGQKIERATDPGLASEDWALNMDICDEINTAEDGAARDAVRAIRKRIHLFSGKNFTAVMYALTVLETCVKNCGHRFHVLVCQKDFIQDLVKSIGLRVEFESPAEDHGGLLATVNTTVIGFAESVENALLGPKNDPPLVVQEKVLSLIASWSRTFRGQPDLNGVVVVHSELVAKGVLFPDVAESAAAVPIITPKASASAPTVVSHVVNPRTATVAPSQTPPTAVTSLQERPSATPLLLNAQQADKLRQEIRVVDENTRVFGEMLTQLRPAGDDPATIVSPDNLQLLQQLAATCQKMQQRMVELVGRVSEDHMIGELLRVNDELNNCFIRYERFERVRKGTGSVSPEKSSIVGSPPSYSMATASAVRDDSNSSATLIDFGCDGGAVSADSSAASRSQMGQQMAGLSLGPSPGRTAEASGAGGALGQLSRITAVSAATGDVMTTASGGGSRNQVDGGPSTALSGNTIHREADFDEMEQWLKSDTGAGLESSMTSSEFDRFLAERAAAPDGAAKQ